MTARVPAGLILFLLFSCSYVPTRYLSYTKTYEPVEINSGLGYLFNREEADSFGIFKNIPGFISAAFYKIPEGGYEIIISTNGGKYKVLNRDPYGLEILKECFNDPDGFKFIEKKILQIVDFDDLGLPISSLELYLNRKRFEAIYLGGITGCLSVVLPAILVINILPREDIPPSGPGDWSCTMTTADYCCGLATVGAIVTTPVGCIMGGNIDKKKALQAIKKSRQPVKME